jgi:DNA-binding XRE family transcriptional regulator
MSSITDAKKATIVDMQTLGDRIRELREESDESQSGLAKIVGVKKQAIWAIENGGTQEPAATTILPIARHYGVNAWWLLYGEGPKHAETASDGQSQAERYSNEMISDTVRIVMEDLERRREFSLLKDLEQFVLYFLDILKIRASWQLKPTPENYVELGRAIERKAALGGGMGNERDARTSDTGLSGRNSAKKQRSKT